MAQLYGPPSDGSVIPHELEDAIAGDFRDRSSPLRGALDAALHRQKHKLGPLFAGYATRTLRAVGVVFVGSSTTAGGELANSANRWVNRVAGKMQAAYPSGTGTESTVGTLSTAPITTPGIHAYNGGIGGGRSSTYLTDDTVAAIGTIAPVAVVHQIGSNDMWDNMTPETYRANLVGWLDKLDTAIASPYVNVLLHSQPRLGTFAYPWDDYRDVLEQLAAERGNCVILDASQFYEAARVPDPDPFDLLSTDGVHMTVEGHDLMHRIVCEALLSPWFQQPTTTAAAPTVQPVVPQSFVRSSDSARGIDAANIVGRAVDNDLGGSKAVTWAGSSVQPVSLIQGVYTGPTTDVANNYAFGVDVPILDYEFSWEIVKLHTVGTLFFEARRGAVDSAPARDLRLSLIANGSFSLGYRDDALGTVTLHTGGAGTFQAGDRIGIRAVGGKFTWTKNGVPGAWHDMHADLVDRPGSAVILGLANTIGWQLARPLILSAFA